MALHHPTLRITHLLASMGTQNIGRRLQDLTNRLMHLVQHCNMSKEGQRIIQCFRLTKHKHFHAARTSTSNHLVQCDLVQPLWFPLLMDMATQHHTAALQIHH
jgi:hypothetical protein